jgi:hypothetical protein
VPSAIDLALLHAVVQIAMGWEDRHLHEWRVGDRTFAADEEEDWGEETESETGVVLAEVAPNDTVIRYDYDLGDGWEHVLEVVSVEPYDGGTPPMAVLDGARACPPEDCGGPSGYEHLLDALADPDDAEHEELTEMFWDWFDPERFSPAEINDRLEPLWHL